MEKEVPDKGQEHRIVCTACEVAPRKYASDLPVLLLDKMKLRADEMRAEERQHSNFALLRPELWNDCKSRSRLMFRSVRWVFSSQRPDQEQQRTHNNRAIGKDRKSVV